MSRLALCVAVLGLIACEDPLVRVASESMAPTFQPGDFLLRHSIDDPEAEVRRGMVVLYEYFDGIPYAEPGGLFLFRAMALPGDRISLQRDTLRINGRVVREPYAAYEWVGGARPDVLPEPTEFPETVVPEGTVFVLGDNRYNAVDSRFHGPVPYERIVGWVAPRAQHR